jgi:hypothetical protein
MAGEVVVDPTGASQVSRHRRDRYPHPWVRTRHTDPARPFAARFAGARQAGTLVWLCIRRSNDALDTACFVSIFGLNPAKMQL